MSHLVKADPRRLRTGEEEDHQALVLTLDPRGRIVAAALFAVLVVALNSLPALGAALLLAAAAMPMARLPVAPTLRKVAAMDAFILAMLAMLPFTTPGEVVFTLGPLEATSEGVLLALSIALKANAIVMLLLALVGTIEPADLGHALWRLRTPPALVHLLLFTVRYIEVLEREYQKLRLAMRARAFQPKNSLHTYRSVGYLVGMLLVRSLDRSEQILAAMKCRGFDGRFYVIEHFRLGRRDAVFGGLASLAGVGLLLLNATWPA